ncbi:hypothetical protein Tco_0561107 [Tanacetum coccineum]
MHTTRGDGVAGIKRRRRDLSSDDVRNLATASGRGILRWHLEEIHEVNKARDTVMSDSEDSTVTYTEVSSPFKGLSDIGSPGVAPPIHKTRPGPEEPDQAPPSLEFVPDPVYPQFMPPEDDVLPAEKKPLPAAVSPTADSLGYVPESDIKEDPEEDDDEDPEEDPADYPANRGDDGDDEDESSDDDEDDDVDIEGGGEEEEHPAPADSTAVACPVMSIRDETPISLPSREEVERLLAIPSPPPSPLSLWSSPLPQIPSPPLPVSPPLLVSPPSPISPPPLPASPTYPLRYRAVMIQLRAEAPSTSHPLPLPSPIAPPSKTPPLLPIPLPTPSPPLLLPSTDRRADVRKACLLPRKRLCFAFGLRYKVGESSSTPIARPDGDFKRDYCFIAILDDEIIRDPERDVGYRIIDTWDEMLVGMPEAPATDETELGRWVTDLVTTMRFVHDSESSSTCLHRDRRAQARALTKTIGDRGQLLVRLGTSMDASDTSVLM